MPPHATSLKKWRRGLRTEGVRFELPDGQTARATALATARRWIEARSSVRSALRPLTRRGRPCGAEDFSVGRRATSAGSIRSGSPSARFAARFVSLFARHAFVGVAKKRLQAGTVRELSGGEVLVWLGERPDVHDRRIRAQPVEASRFSRLSHSNSGRRTHVPDVLLDSDLVGPRPILHHGARRLQSRVLLAVQNN